MPPPDATGRQPVPRALARLLGTFHNISYYAPEMKAFADVGLPEYWRAYMAYRSAPMGVVPAPVVTATFYNFAPRMVEAAIPSAWHSISPADAIALRDDCIERGLRRALGERGDSAEVGEAASIALHAIEGCEAGARPLFAAHAELEIPSSPLMQLWHACTLWREHRGDSHNIALAAAGLDGIACHVLLAGRGIGNKEIITKIRGWTGEEWDAAARGLTTRGFLDGAGAMTGLGRDVRRDVEATTDALTEPPRQRLGATDAQLLVDLMDPLVGALVESGSVAASWPPPSPPK